MYIQNVAGYFGCVREVTCNLNVLHKMYTSVIMPHILVLLPLLNLFSAKVLFTILFCYFKHNRSLLSLFKTKERSRDVCMSLMLLNISCKMNKISNDY